MDRLISKIIEKQNPSVIGLDTKLDYIPKFIKEESYDKFGKNLKGVADAIFAFNKKIIDAIYDIVPAVKPQSAYYEMYGYEGVWALYKTINYAKSKGMYVIADVKRNDIGSTSEAYSAAYLGKTDIENDRIAVFDSDSMTVNGYLGTDGIKPFTNDCEKYGKSIFVLVKTSNPSSGEFQNLHLDGGEINYMRMGRLVEEWGKDLIGKEGYSSVGAVVGATYREEMLKLRAEFKNMFFLVPGYGAQGGSAADAVCAIDKDLKGAIVNSSRGIICAYKKTNDDENFDMAARQAAINMRDELVAAIG